MQYRRTASMGRAMVDLRATGSVVAHDNSWTPEQRAAWKTARVAADALIEAFNRKPRRTRTRLSLAEADAHWVYSATNHCFRFNGNDWQCSKHLYYTQTQPQDSWFNWSAEPQASAGEVFVEMFGDDSNKELARALTEATHQTQGVVTVVASGTGDLYR